MSNSPKTDEPFDPATVPIKPAATVLLIRDRDGGGSDGDPGNHRPGW